MFAAAALVPAAPLIVPELAGSENREAAELRDACLAVAQRMARAASLWVIVGVDRNTAGFDVTAAGTFHGFGADVDVRFSDEVNGPIDPALPLPLLIGAWLRENSDVGISAIGQTIGCEVDVAECHQAAAAVRALAEDSEEAVGVLVVADGSTKLDQRAPGGFDAAAVGFQERVDHALGTADHAGIATFSPDECDRYGAYGRVGWQFLSGLFAPHPVTVATAYQGRPFGVGYQVSYWTPSGG